MNWATAFLALLASSNSNGTNLTDSISGFHRFKNFSADWANIFGVVGFIITIGGFGFTIWAALRAASAANKARQAINKADTISNFATGIGAMEQIKHHLRAQAWEDALDSIETSKRVLMEVKSGLVIADSNEAVEIQGAIAQLLDIETKIEKVLEGKPVPKVSNLNKIMSIQIAKIHEISIKLKRKD